MGKKEVMSEIHIGDIIITPVGDMTVDEWNQEHIYLSGHGFTWTGTVQEFKRYVIKGIIEGIKNKEISGNESALKVVIRLNTELSGNIRSNE